MPMTKQEAAEIIKLAHNVYEMKAEMDRAKLWLDLLTESGDYQPTMDRLKQYIKDGNPYPPKIPDIMRSYPKQLKYEVDEQTKEHQKNMQQDEDYRKKRAEALKRLREKMKTFGGEDYV